MSHGICECAGFVLAVLVVVVVVLVVFRPRAGKTLVHAAPEVARGCSRASVIFLLLLLLVNVVFFITSIIFLFVPILLLLILVNFVFFVLLLVLLLLTLVNFVLIVPFQVLLLILVNFVFFVTFICHFVVVAQFVQLLGVKDIIKTFVCTGVKLGRPPEAQLCAIEVALGFQDIESPSILQSRKMFLLLGKVGKHDAIIHNSIESKILLLCKHLVWF